MNLLSNFDFKKGINFLLRNIILTFPFFITSISLLKLWLDLSLSIKVLSFQSYDDALYVSFAQSILRGEWLGNYNELTLTKNPLYPLWLAFNHIIGLPLLFTQSLLYAISGILLIYQLRKIGMNYVCLISTYVLYLFNPFVETRVMREGIYSSLTVLIFTCLIGLFRHLLSSKSMILRWSLLLGIFLSMFWLTREEGAWMLPTIILFLCCSAILLYNKFTLSKEFFWRLSFIMFPFIILFLSFNLMSLINYYHYSEYRINEQNSKPFVSAYGSLLRIKTSHWIRGFLVPRDVREQIYKVSPAFRELKPYIDGNEGSKDQRDEWMRISCSFYPNTTPDYGGAWFMWTFRKAVADAGYYSSASAADSYYERLAKEVNSACENHLVDCLSRWETIIPPYRQEYTNLLLTSFAAGFNEVLTIPVRDYVTSLAVSTGNEDGLRSFHALTNNRVLPTLEMVKKGDFKDYFIFDTLDLIKLRILHGISILYQNIFSYVVYISMVAYLISLLFTLGTREMSFLFGLSSLIAVSIAFRLLILSYVDITLFPAFANWPAYITPFYPLFFLFIGIVLADTIAKLGTVKKRLIINGITIHDNRS